MTRAHDEDALPAIRWSARLIYYIILVPAATLFLLLYRIRVWGTMHIPPDGPVLYLSNHQSFMDPVLHGIAASRRPFHALARASLGEVRGLRTFYRVYNAIFVKRGQMDVRALKTCVKVLKAGRTLLLYPEGTRGSGTTQALQEGTMLLIRRGRPWVVPVAVEGGRHVWPRDRKLPRLRGRMGIMYGQPIDPDTLLAMDDAQAVAYLRDRIESLRLEVERRLHHMQAPRT